MFSTLNNMMSSPLNSKAVSLLNMDTLADRLRWALAQAGMKPAHLAKNAKISRGTISLWLSGTTKRAGGDNLARAARELKVDLNWLTTGVGSPIADYAHSEATRLIVEQRPAGLMGDLMQIAEQLSDRGLIELIGAARAFAGIHPKSKPDEKKAS